MINFEQYLAERSIPGKLNIIKRKVTEDELREMVKNKDSGIADVDVSEVTNMKELFENSDFGGSWTADLSGWDISNVTDMRGMFARCSSLKEINLPRTENVKDMSWMFNGCTKLTKVELPHTENVKSMWSMFYLCSGLTKVELPHTENVKSMWSMFKGCTSLEQDFSKWDISNVKHKANMFDGTKVTKFPKGYKQ